MKDIRIYDKIFGKGNWVVFNNHLTHKTSLTQEEIEEKKVFWESYFKKADKISNINSLFNTIIDKLEALPVLDRKPDLINEDGSYNKEQVKKQLNVYNAMYKAALAKQKRDIATDLDLAIINAHEEALLKVDKFVLLANKMRDVLVQKVENDEDISSVLEYLSNLNINSFDDLTDEKLQEIMDNLGM